MSKVSLSFLLFFIANFVFAQTFEPIQIPFDINGNDLKLTLVGGLNSPQFSKIDLNNDGVEDLYIFDKSNDAQLPFLATEENGIIEYTFAYEYVFNFPDCASWVALRDYNGDGIHDLFTVDAESQVYRGIYVDDQITFELVEPNQGNYFNFLTYRTDDNDIDFIPLFADDFPVIVDIDGDTDLDILGFGGSTSVHFYKNQAIENGYPLDSLTFRLEDICWGRFKRGGNNEVILGNNINECGDGFDQTVLDDRAHLALTLMVFDDNQDGDMDAIVGAPDNPGFTKLTNSSVANIDFMTEAIPMFPTDDVPVEIFSYPSAFYVDIDNDGIEEFIASPNQKENGEDLESAWLYKNIGTLDSIVWELQQTDWLMDEMLDVGSNSAPCFVDYNADGLMDLVVGNGGKWFWTSRGSLTLYENTGSTTAPSFTLVEEDWLNFSEFNDSLSNFTPTFGDMDNDGDLDLLVGTERGDLIYAENTGGMDNPVQFSEKTITWKNILVGKQSVPQIADINRDGLLDLIVGEQNGNLNYFPNQGTLENPEFTPNPDLSPNDYFFGKINASAPGVVTGNAVPFLIDRNSHYSLILGTAGVGLEFYEFSENDLENTIPPNVLNWGDIRIGDYLYPALADLNDDGFLELVVGNRRGGLTFFGSNLGVTGTEDIVEDLSLKIFPNPVRDVLHIEHLNAANKDFHYSIYNNLGQIITSNIGNEVSVKDLPKGIYFLEILVDKKREVMKFVKE